MPPQTDGSGEEARVGTSADRPAAEVSVLYQNLYQALLVVLSAGATFVLLSSFFSSSCFLSSACFLLTTSTTRFMLARSTRLWYWQYSYARILIATPEPTAQLADFGTGASIHGEVSTASPFPKQDRSGSHLR